MKKALLIILTIILTLGAMVGLSVTAFAQDTVERDIIPLPEIPAINRPYRTTEELGIDFKAFDEYFPQNIEIRQEDGKIYVEDIGAGCAKFYTSQTKDLELVDGYWTGDIEGDLQFVYFYSYENHREDKYWHVVYHSDGERDPYINLQDDSLYIGFSYESAMVSYDSGDYFYVDQYTNGVLDTHGVENRKDTVSVKVYYDVNGEVSYCQLYTNTYYYYYPNQGWSSSWFSFIECDAPAGYENIDETYFTVNKPSLICNSAERDDIVHDMLDASCMEPKTCKNGCGHTEGEVNPDAHAWNEGAITTEPNCTAKGVKTYTCTYNSAHTYTEDVDALGHTEEIIAEKTSTCTETGLTDGKKCSVCDEILVAQTDIAKAEHIYDNACDADCNTCGEERTPAEHVDADENNACDVCNAELPKNGLSGGAIAGIVIGIVAVLGGGGFALFWFVIRKKIKK